LNTLPGDVEIKYEAGEIAVRKIREQRVAERIVFWNRTSTAKSAKSRNTPDTVKPVSDAPTVPQPRRNRRSLAVPSCDAAAACKPDPFYE